jgi:branched-chain amino acid transport system substrate-binding protein
VTYDVTDPTVDSQIVQLQASGANVLFNISTPKFAAQAIRKTYDIGWKPAHYLNSVSNSVGSVLSQAGLDKSVGVISGTYLKDATDPRWRDDPGIAQWREFMKKYYPEGNVADILNVYGYTAAATLHHVLKQSGDNLTRENVMRQATSMQAFRVETLLPSISMNTGPSDYAPLESVQLQRFDGKQWQLFGPVMGK